MISNSDFEKAWFLYKTEYEPSDDMERVDELKKYVRFRNPPYERKVIST